MARKVLNVGGGSRAIAIPEYYKGWLHHLLDIDPKGAPDIVDDARNLQAHAPNVYDAVYCSHNIEHYYPHDVPKVLRGFLHVLKPEGFAEIRCPDIGAVMRQCVAKNLDIDDVLYQSGRGPILVRDVIYGYGVEIEQSGNDYYAHKTGFTQKSLIAAVRAAGFAGGQLRTGNYELVIYAFKTTPSSEFAEMLGLDLP